MAVKDVLPYLLDSSFLRRCTRASSCFFVSSLVLVLLLVQFDLIPQINMQQQVRDFQKQVSGYIHKLKTTTSSSTPPLASMSEEVDQSTSSLPPSARQQPLSTSESGSTSSSTTSSLLTPPTSHSSTMQSTGRVAICLVGGARAFELTGPTIKKYLLEAIPNSDVFLHCPLDKDSYKLSLLMDTPNLVHVRIFSPEHIPENNVLHDVLTAANSPNGIQGLLQYFKLVEGCLDMINQYQLQYNFTYEWVVRTRVDGYWNDFFPSFKKRNSAAYTVPVGSEFGGLNDRLGVGSWETTKVALARLSLIPTLHVSGARGCNSERSFKDQLMVMKIPSKKSGFPFCILSHRRYGFPPGYSGVPVLSITSKGNMNGAKCRPCTPASRGASAKAILKMLRNGWGWPGDIKDPELCNAAGPWESNWESIFDSVAGSEIAKIRKDTVSQNLSACVRTFESWRVHVMNWDAPDPETLCEKGLGESG
ncbi:hypothetical protein KP509_31G044800 [Ceratopteris richardii]|uniref:DUF7796 domain-containing protein n=1 Tax=Ceratopteris richardii TaxID=49495 RepID=A0A8T2QZE8_CERRI|nr:hypothetical protein KP509_31G044800 [Ceratopteris richardii]